MPGTKPRFVASKTLPTPPEKALLGTRRSAVRSFWQSALRSVVIESKWRSRHESGSARRF